MEPAAAANAAERPPEPPAARAVIDDDAERPGLPSDDEDGPPEPDEDEDARAPGDDEAEDEVADEAAAAAAAAPGAADAPAATAPALPPSIKTCLVAELKEHLKWRGEPQNGKKQELIDRLQAAIDEGKQVLDELPESTTRAKSGAPEKPKVKWVPIVQDDICRPCYDGPEKLVPNEDLKLTPTTHPFEYMCCFYPQKIRDVQVDNTERYRGFVKCNATEIYKHVRRIDAAINNLAHATYILQGASPVPTQRTMYKQSFAFKGHRGADLLRRDEWLAWKTFFHISHPGQAPKRGTKDWDELHKVRPMLDEYLRACVENVSAGRRFSIDEITIGFQGHHARLKQRCGKFKRAGDGFQARVT